MADASSSDVSDGEILMVFAETEKSPLRPAAVADDLPIPTEQLRDRLDELSELGHLARDPDRLGGEAWYLTAEGASRLGASDEEIVTDVEAQATATGTGSLPRDQETPESPPPEPGDATVDPPYEPPSSAFDTFDPPGTPEEKERRTAALRAAYDYLRSHGRACRADFVEDVFPDAPGAYDEPTDGWWEEVIRPGLEHLPGPEPADGADAWRFDEDENVRDVEE